MIILTGDTHREFDSIVDFCEEYQTTQDDVIIVLGDVGINYCLDSRDDFLKEELSHLPITLFCIHGNHEERPENLPNYQEKCWHDGIILYEEEYPNILFAQDGEIYDFGGKKAIVIGGAYSVDKYYRISGGAPWFASEQPDEHTKAYVEAQLEKVGWKINYVLSHTVPLSFEPQEAFLPNMDQSTLDKTTEEWLDTIEQKLQYEAWYAGHFHVDWNIGRVRILFEEFLELREEYA